MPESLILPDGFPIKFDDRKYTLSGNYVVTGDIVPEKDKATQKTYNLKVICPTCHRIGRFTQKNWQPNDTRQAVMCLHVDGTSTSMELVDATEEPDYAG